MPPVYAHLDAAESVFFSRELEHIKAKTYLKKYAKLIARALIPISREAGPHAESITYRMLDRVGIAKIIADYAQDLPRVDVYGKEYTSPVKGIGASYGYSVQEVRAAVAHKKPLKQDRANQAKQACLTKEDDIAASGDSATGLSGLLNNSNVTGIDGATKDAGGTTWAVATVAEIKADFHSLVMTPYSATNGHEFPTTVALDPDNYALIAITQNSAASDKTILEWLLEKYKAFGLKEIIPWYKCSGAGDSSTNRAVAYVRDIDYVSLEIPQDFEQFPAQAKGLEFVVPCHMRTGGVIFTYPITAAYMDGI